MKDVQKAIKDITYHANKYPKEAVEIIIQNKEQAVPYLREAIEFAIQEKDDIDDNYDLYFYAFYLLAELQDKEVFPKMIELASLPEEVLEILFGDAVTDLEDVLYNTYNGDIGLLEQAVLDLHTYDYVKSAVLSVLGQLYLDGELEKNRWKEFILKIIYGDEKLGEYMYTELAWIICGCHLVEMLPDVQALYDKGLVEEMSIGDYDSCVDEMFRYKDKQFCRPSVNTEERIRQWLIFKDEQTPKQTPKMSDKALKEFTKKIRQEAYEKGKKIDIGRNDPCPCGSGKKYKHCCLNKPKSELDMIESELERKKWLKDYPETGTEKIAGRVYLEDYFDAESIEIDKLLYLGIHHRPEPIWRRNLEQEKRRAKAYLNKAFIMFSERIEREGIKSLKEYDKQYAIHYFSAQWLCTLLDILEEDEDYDNYKTVRKLYSKLDKR